MCQIEVSKQPLGTIERLESRVFLSAYSPVVYSFDPSNGSQPRVGVTMDASGDLFGTTQAGGPNGDGSVFEIPSGSTAITSIASFDGANGNYPVGALSFDASGDLYGTSEGGGPNGLGTIFEIAKDSTTITTLVNFDGTNGGSPWAGVTFDSSGNMYGTTTQGPQQSLGSVFEVPKGSNAVTTLASFHSSNGASPYCPVIFDAEGDLFGTTNAGGTYDNGTVFEIASGSGSLTTLASFSFFSFSRPNGLAIDASGNLYGTAGFGGSGHAGAIFEISRGSTTVTALAYFDGSNGKMPEAGVTLDPSGNLFGTTTFGGPNSDGTVFELPKGSDTIQVLDSFSGTDGAGPTGGITLDALGNLYGTTCGGGTSSDGTVFELVPNTAVALVSAGGPNPSIPSQPLSFTATIAGGIPDGETVNLQDASNGNAVVATGTLSNGSATLTVPANTLSAGTHNLIAVYGGDATFGASESAPYVQVVHPAQATVTSVAINGDIPLLAGSQRSIVEDVVYTFSEPVNIADANQAFTVSVSGNMGSVPGTLLATAVVGSNNTQWAVSLTGQADGVLGSIANGEYSIAVNPQYVVAASDNATQLSAGRTDTFYRLFGDYNGDGVVNAIDNARLKTALSVYSPIFDFNADGVVNAFDNAQFKKSMSISFLGFNPTI